VRSATGNPRPHSRAGYERGHGYDDLRRVQGFDDMRLVPYLERADAIGGAAVRTDRNSRHLPPSLWRPFSQLSHQRQSVLAFEADIADDDVDRMGVQRLKRMENRVDPQTSTPQRDSTASMSSRESG
jgi:hypothetical protein